MSREVTALRKNTGVLVTGLQGTVRNTFRTGRTIWRFANVEQENGGTIAFDMDRLGENSGFEVAGLLGAPVLTKLRVTLDYRNGCVRFDTPR